MWNQRRDAFYITVILLLSLTLIGQGRTLERLSQRMRKVITPREAYARIRQAPGIYQVIDLRGIDDYAEGHLPGALLLGPELPLDRYKPTILVSEDGDPGLFRRKTQELRLRSSINLQGGMVAWRQARLPEQSGIQDFSRLARGPIG